MCNCTHAVSDFRTRPKNGARRRGAATTPRRRRLVSVGGLSGEIIARSRANQPGFRQWFRHFLPHCGCVYRQLVVRVKFAALCVRASISQLPLYTTHVPPQLLPNLLFPRWLPLENAASNISLFCRPERASRVANVWTRTAREHSH